MALTLAVLSSDPVMSMEPSLENSTQRTVPVWALRTVERPSLVLAAVMYSSTRWSIVVREWHLYRTCSVHNVTRYMSTPTCTPLQGFCRLHPLLHG